MGYNSSEITDILMSAYNEEQAFYTIEVSSRGPSRRKLKQVIREAENTRAFLTSRGALNPKVNSWLICRSQSITKRNQEWIDQLDQIYASILRKEFIKITREKILKVESYLNFTLADRIHVKDGPLNIKRFGQVNIATQGKLLEEYYSQIMHTIFPHATLLPRVAYNGNAETLKFILENEEERKTSEVDILMTADEGYISNRLSCLEEQCGFVDLKKLII